MPQVLVVEGLTDATFFQGLLQRLYLQDAQVEYDRSPGRRNIPKIVRGVRAGGALLEVEFRNHIDGGEGKIPDAIKFLLDEDIREFAVAQDLDDGTPDQLIEAIRQVVYSHLRVPITTPLIPSRRIEIEGGAITVIPMGLHQDDTLSSLRITSHAMEDYLIKLLLEDAGLRQRVPELQGLLLEILPTIRQHNGHFNSSKELFQLVKPIIQHGFSDSGAIQNLFSNADPDILRSVLAPLLPDVELALVPQ